MQLQLKCCLYFSYKYEHQCLREWELPQAGAPSTCDNTTSTGTDLLLCCTYVYPQLGKHYVATHIAERTISHAHICNETNEICTCCPPTSQIIFMLIAFCMIGYTANLALLWPHPLFGLFLHMWTIKLNYPGTHSHFFSTSLPVLCVLSLCHHLPLILWGDWIPLFLYLRVFLSLETALCTCS